MPEKKRYALVGTGGRARAYIAALLGDHNDEAELVALCDPSQVRMDYYNDLFAGQLSAAPRATYHADDFDKMVREQRPDVIVVTAMDSVHHVYVSLGMELGCDIICEKPLTTDLEKLRTILDAVDRTGRSLRVTFNMRYSAHGQKVRELLMQGVIGKPLSVDLNWMLDISHGADYFRRWHREKDKSGGLLLTKASHHFDLINWWVDSWMDRIYCIGELKFYGRQNAEARGESYPYERYTGQPEAAGDPFALRLDDHPTRRGLYLEAEKETGYLRDQNVFGEGITIEDTMSISGQYKNGVVFNYSLVAYSPWEGFRAAINGTKGRIELFKQYKSPVMGMAGGNPGEAEAKEPEQNLRVFPMFGRPYEVEIPKLEGGHGGSDPLLMRDLFSSDPGADPLNRRASHLDGAASVLVGISANHSIATGMPVNCDDLVALKRPKGTPIGAK